MDIKVGADGRATGIGPLALGAPRSAALAAMKGQECVWSFFFFFFFLASHASGRPLHEPRDEEGGYAASDIFMDAGVKVDYDKEDKIDTVELSQSALKKSVTLNGTDLVKLGSFDKVFTFVKTVDAGTEKTETGFFAPKLHLNAYERKGAVDMLSICTPAYHAASLEERAAPEVRP